MTATAGLDGEQRAIHLAAVIRYSPVAIALHWAIAALIILTVPLGFYGARVDGTTAQLATNTHKSIGLSILALTLFRIAWRLSHPVPPLPQTMGWVIRISARLTHGLFYVLLLALPLTGWWMSSAAPQRHPFGFLGLFEFPFLPIAQSMASAGPAHDLHVRLGWLMSGLTILHIAAAMKHHFVDRDDILTRVMPIGAPAERHSE